MRVGQYRIKGRDIAMNVGKNGNAHAIIPAGFVRLFAGVLRSNRSVILIRTGSSPEPGLSASARNGMSIWSEIDSMAKSVRKRFERTPFHLPSRSGENAFHAQQPATRHARWIHRTARDEVRITRVLAPNAEDSCFTVVPAFEHV
jgi:hypothetical protein